VRGEKLARRAGSLRHGRGGLDGRVNRRLPFNRRLGGSENRDGFERFQRDPLAARAALARERRGALPVKLDGTQPRRRRPHGTRGGRVQVDGRDARRRARRRCDDLRVRRAGDRARGGAARREHRHGRAVLARETDHRQHRLAVDRAARSGNRRHHVERVREAQELRRRHVASVVPLASETDAGHEVREIRAHANRNILRNTHCPILSRGTHRASRVHVVAWIARIVTLA